METYPLRIICLSSTSPAPTGSGGAVALFGGGSALAKNGYEVSFIVIASPDRHEYKVSNFPVYMLNARNDLEPSRQLAQLLSELAPDIVWIYHQPGCWSLFSDLRKDFPHILYTVDPFWEIEILRNRWRKQGPNFVKYLMNIFQHRRKVLNLRLEEKRDLHQVLEAGIVAGFVKSHTNDMVKRTGVSVTACPLAYPDWGLRQGFPNAHQFLLLGNMNSAHTRYGLRFFFDEVWPAWSKSVKLRQTTVRVVGGGKLPENFLLPPPHDQLKWIGFAPSLEEEWNMATAMLVPVPLEQGTRTRVIEAWCRGVPVIAHPSAEKGIPEMCPEENYLAATNSNEWLEAVLRVEKEASLVEKLSARGRETYLKYYSIDSAANRFSELAHKAIEKYKSRIY